MENQPNKIYLNLGFNPRDYDKVDFKDLQGVTWSEDKTHEHDIPFVSEEYALQEVLKGKIEVLEELATEAISKASYQDSYYSILNKITEIKNQMK